MSDMTHLQSLDALLSQCHSLQCIGHHPSCGFPRNVSRLTAPFAPMQDRLCLSPIFRTFLLPAAHSRTESATARAQMSRSLSRQRRRRTDSRKSSFPAWNTRRSHSSPPCRNPNPQIAQSSRADRDASGTPPGPHPPHRCHRLRQIVNHGCARKPDQLQPPGPHHHYRRSRRVRASESAITRRADRTRYGHEQLR